MSKQDLFMKKITSLIEKSGLTEEKDIKKFIEENLIGKDIDNFFGNVDESSDEEMAISYIEQVYETEDVYDKVTLIESALDYDDTLLEGYLLLSQCVIHPFLSKYFLETGIKIGKKKFPKSFLKENKESLYYMQDVRPFLKLHDALGQTYFMVGNYFASISVYEKLLKINPSDNLNAKEYLGLQYLLIEEFDDYKKLSDSFQESKDISLLYNDVYYTFVYEQNLLKAKHLLSKAKEHNSNVINKILTKNSKLNLSDTFAIGSVEEANNYCYYACEMWQENDEIINWLKQNK